MDAADEGAEDAHCVGSGWSKGGMATYLGSDVNLEHRSLLQRFVGTDAAHRKPFLAQHLHAVCIIVILVLGKGYRVDRCFQRRWEMSRRRKQLVRCIFFFLLAGL